MSGSPAGADAWFVYAPSVRLRATILVKLLVALVLPAVVLFTLFALVAYEVSRHDLDEELGRRLEAIAASATTQIRGKYLLELEAGEEQGRAYQNAVTKLAAIETVTGVHLFMFDRSFNARGDTASATAIGTTFARSSIAASSSGCSSAASTPRR